MLELRPASEPELCEAMRAAAEAKRPVELGGAFSKRRMNESRGEPANTVISTACLRRVLQYEPRDLTISVEAGLPFSELSALLASNRQMVALDPPYFETATVGGVIAANCSGPRRRLYGTARDCVIGITYVKLDGKFAKSGGMVVKNVAGFDIAKLMIGSFGTLAALAVVNFKLSPMPPQTRTFAMQFESVAAGLEARDRILRGVLQPAAIDALNPAAAAILGLDGFVLLLQAGGSTAVMARYVRELAGAREVEGAREQQLWDAVREFTPAFVRNHDEAHVARVSSTLSGVAAVLASTDAPIVSRAASGVSYVHFENSQTAREWASRKELRYAFEYGEPRSNEMSGAGFEIMKAVKTLFDPDHILNSGRLYGRI